MVEEQQNKMIISYPEVTKDVRLGVGILVHQKYEQNVEKMGNIIDIIMRIKRLFDHLLHIIEI